MSEGVAGTALAGTERGDSDGFDRGDMGRVAAGDSGESGRFDVGEADRAAGGNESVVVGVIRPEYLAGLLERPKMLSSCLTLGCSALAVAADVGRSSSSSSPSMAFFSGPSPQTVLPLSRLTASISRAGRSYGRNASSACSSSAHEVLPYLTGGSERPASVSASSSQSSDGFSSSSSQGDWRRVGREVSGAGDPRRKRRAKNEGSGVNEPSAAGCDETNDDR